MTILASVRLCTNRGFATALCCLVLSAAVSCGGSAQATASPSPSAAATSSPGPGQGAASPTPSRQPGQRIEAHLPVVLEESAAASVGGKLYVMGGFDAAGRSLRTVYIFDGRTWSAGPSLPLGLDHAAAAAIADRLYLSGGHSFGADSARVFRLDGSSWTELRSMRHARGGHALIAAGGLLYSIGGNTTAGNVSAVEAYNPGSGRWSDVASLPVPRNHVAGFVLGTRVCVAGGRSPNTKRVDCLDSQSRRWTRLADLPGATSGGGAVTFADGSVVVMGGEDALESQMVAQLARLSSTGRWSVRESMLVPRHGFQLALFDGRAWACGGGSAPGLHPVSTCTSVA